MASGEADAKSYVKLAQICKSFQKRYPTHLVIERILKKEGDINCRIPLDSYGLGSEVKGLTALQIAAKKNETKAVVSLLTNGVDIAVQDQKGRTALHYAFYHPSPKKELIDIMLFKQWISSDTRNPCDVNGVSHFHIACLYNHTDAMENFINSSVSVDISVNSNANRFGGYTPLHFAAEGVSVSAIIILMENNANVNVMNARGLTPLHILLEKKINFFDLHTSNYVTELSETVQDFEDAMDSLMCIDEVNDIGLTKLHIACTRRDMRQVENYLAQNVIDLNVAIRRDSPIYPGYTPLHFAAHCSIGIVKILLNKRANLEAKDANGVTPMDLLWKKYEGQELCSIFETTWANLTFSDNEARLLDFIRCSRQPDVMGTYLRSVRDLETTMQAGAASWKGRTLLHFAVMLCNNIEVIKFCIEQHILDSLVNVPDFSGSTPIHLAFRLNKSDVVECLMGCCIDVHNFADADGLSYLHIACATAKKQYVDKVRLDDENINLVYRGKATYGWITPGSTALHVAVASGNIDNIGKLLEHDISVEDEDDNGQTPLDRFLQLDGKDAVPVCRTLMWNPTVTNEMLQRIGLTRLHMSIICQEYMNIRQYEHNDDINAVIRHCRGSSSFLKDYEGFTALQMAIVKRMDIEVLKKLIDQGSNPLLKNQQGNSAFHLALRQPSNWNGINALVDILLYNTTFSRQFEEMSGITMLHIACYMKNLNVALWLISRSVDINSRVRSDCPIWANYTPLHALLDATNNAEPNGNLFNILYLLIKYGADVSAMDVNNETPIHFSAYFSTPRNHGIVNILVENIQVCNGNPVDRNGISLFHLACLVNNVKIVKSFVENGADVNQPVNFFAQKFAGETPLHLAMEYKTPFNSKQETISILLSNGADVKAENNFGSTVLHKAVKLSYVLDILNVLLPYGIALNSQDIFGKTPLELLVISKKLSMEIIRFFGINGSPLNSSNPLTEEGYISKIISTGYNQEHINDLIRIFSIEVATLPVHFLAATMNSINGYGLDDMGRNLIHNIVTTQLPNLAFIRYDLFVELFRLLNFNIDHQDTKGKTALHLSVQFGNKAAVCALLHGGADINILDAANMTPANYILANRPINLDICTSWILQVRKMEELKLEIHPNNSWARMDFWNFISQTEAEKMLVIVEATLAFSIVPELYRVWYHVVNENPILFLGDFLRETGRGLILYTRMPSLRNNVDQYFRNYIAGDFRGISVFQYRKAVQRVSLMESAVNSILTIAGLNLPLEIIEMILQYLSNSNLKNLNKAVELAHRGN